MKPTNETMKEIVKFITQTKGFHFLIAMRDHDKYYDSSIFKPLEEF